MYIIHQLDFLGNVEAQFGQTSTSIKNRLGQLALKLLAAKNRLTGKA
jgi:hypothetical protein